MQKLSYKLHCLVRHIMPSDLQEKITTLLLINNNYLNWCY